MSSEALAWAFKSTVKPSSVKFTLVALCECANYRTGKIFPSIEHLCEITGQDRKTVIANVGKLVAEGWIHETGERVGKTGQIKVYLANIGTVPNSEQSQKRNSSEFPVKESQKWDTEPSREPSRHRNTKRALPDHWHPVNFDPQSKSAHIIAGWTQEEYQTALEHFVQHHRSKGSKFVDWQSAWGTWVLNSAKYKGHSNGKANRTGSNIQRGSSGDGFTAVLREVGSRDDAFQASGNDGGMQQAPRISFSPSGRD